jgi:hypothetical protein
MYVKHMTSPYALKYEPIGSTEALDDNNSIETTV